MSTRERPIELMHGSRNLSLGELTRMAAAVERITTMQGSNLIQGQNGMVFKDQPISTIWAKITDKDASDPIKYTWEQVWPDGDGGWLEETGAPGGDDTSLPAYEANNLDLDLTDPIYVELYIFNGSMLFYAGSSASSGGGGGSGVTVAEQDGSPSYTSIITIQMNQDDGLIVTQPGAGIALVSISDASSSTPGIVTTGTQTFAGDKTFEDKVDCQDSVNFDGFIQLQASTIGTVQTGKAYFSASTNQLAGTVISYSTIAGGWYVVSDASAGTTRFLLTDNNYLGSTSVAYQISQGGSTSTGASGTDSIGNVFVGGICTSVAT